MAKRVATWKKRPGRQEFASALNYLSLQLPGKLAAQLVSVAKRTPPVSRVAKDVLRASRLPLLPPDELHVAKDLKRIHKGKRLAPVIFVQGDLSHARPPIIADGYHRMCAACHADEDTPVSIVLVPVQ